MCVTLGAALWGAPAERARGVYKEARKALDKGDYTQAYLLSSQAVALDPETPEYWQFSQAVRTRGLAGLKVELTPEQNVETAAPTLPPVADEDYRQARTALPPPILHGAAGRKSFHLRVDAKQLFERLAKDYGLDVVFDSDYQAGSPVEFRLEDADWKEALRAAESVTGSFLVALSEKLALVAKDTTQKRTELERVMTVLIPFPEPLTPQDVQEAARAVQSTFDMTKMGIDNNRRIVLFRDRVSRLRPAMDLFQQLMVHRAQVVTEVELLSVNDNSDLSYGLDLQTSFPVVMLGNPTPFQTPSPTLSPNMASFGGGKTKMAVSIASTNLLARMSKGESRSLVKAELRGVDGQPAQLHVGDRYPIMTNGYFGNTTGTGTVYTPPPTVNFEDLGVVLKVTPRVHGVDSVSLEIEAEFKTLTGEALNGIPVIANRKFTTRVRTTFEETTVIAGLVRETLSQSWSGIPLLVKVPALRNNDKSSDLTQILLTLRPRLVNLPPSEIPTVAVRAGSETRPLTPLD